MRTIIIFSILIFTGCAQQDITMQATTNAENQSNIADNLQTKSNSKISKEKKNYNKKSNNEKLKHRLNNIIETLSAEKNKAQLLFRLISVDKNLVRRVPAIIYYGKNIISIHKDLKKREAKIPKNKNLREQLINYLDQIEKHRQNYHSTIRIMKIQWTNRDELKRKLDSLIKKRQRANKLASRAYKDQQKKYFKGQNLTIEKIKRLIKKGKNQYSKLLNFKRSFRNIREKYFWSIPSSETYEFQNQLEVYLKDIAADQSYLKKLNN